MTAFVLKYGKHWNEAAMDWSVGRLRHRGRSVRIFRSRRLEIHAFGNPPETLRNWRSRTWTWGIEEYSSRREIPDFAFSEEKASELPVRFPGGVIVRQDRRTGQIGIHCGTDSAVPVLFARRGRSLLVAPEMKAFSDIPDRKRIKRLEPGCSLFFDPSHKETHVRRAEEKWRAIPLTTWDYATCKGKVAELLDQAAQELKNRHQGTLAASLSGGLDSNISVWLARKAEIECEAFTVWFDSGSDLTPPDLVGARMTAESLQIPLREIRIGPEDIEDLARRSVFLSEETYWRHVETGAYVIRLIQELRGRGYKSVLTGLGGDGYFGGRIFPSQLGEGFQKSMVAWRRQRFALSKLSSQLGMRLLSPFFYPPIADFALRLPESFLVEEIQGKLQGKKILRDIYAKQFASPLVSMAKDFPFNTAGSEALFKNQWGGRKRREALYARWMEEDLVIPGFRRRHDKRRLLDRVRLSR